MSSESIKETIAEHQAGRDIYKNHPQIDNEWKGTGSVSSGQLKETTRSYTAQDLRRLNKNRRPTVIQKNPITGQTVEITDDNRHQFNYKPVESEEVGFGMFHVALQLAEAFVTDANIHKKYYNSRSEERDRAYNYKTATSSRAFTVLRANHYEDPTYTNYKPCIEEICEELSKHENKAVEGIAKIFKEGLKLIRKTIK